MRLASLCNLPTRASLHVIFWALMNAVIKKQDPGGSPKCRTTNTVYSRSWIHQRSTISTLQARRRHIPASIAAPNVGSRWSRLRAIRCRRNIAARSTAQAGVAGTAWSAGSSFQLQSTSTTTSTQTVWAGLRCHGYLGPATNADGTLPETGPSS